MTTTASTTPSLTSVSGEDEKRRQLFVMKMFATGLLILAAIVFGASRWYLAQGAPHWVEYVEAAAEAAMVGALADWFAVTALFRHPLGLPIPHTAIIRRKKDQLGESLGSFVGENFLNAELVSEKVASAEIPLRAGQWLQTPANSQRASAEVAKIVDTVLKVVKNEDVASIIEKTIITRVAEPLWGPPVGRLLQNLLEEQRHVPVLDLVSDRTYRWVRDNDATIQRWIDEKAPTWAPQFVNELLSDRAHRELTEWTFDISQQGEHPVRIALEDFAVQFAHGLQHDPQMMTKLEAFKAEVMGREEVQSASLKVWLSGREMITAAVEDPNSELRLKMVEGFTALGNRLASDDEFRAKIDDYLTRTAAMVADNYSGEVTGIISETVQRWDAEEASEKIELQVGKDLQFIRINGTVVGALAGLLIHACGDLLF